MRSNKLKNKQNVRVFMESFYDTLRRMLFTANYLKSSCWTMRRNDNNNECHTSICSKALYVYFKLCAVQIYHFTFYSTLQFVRPSRSLFRRDNRRFENKLTINTNTAYFSSTIIYVLYKLFSTSLDSYSISSCIYTNNDNSAGFLWMSRWDQKWHQSTILTCDSCFSTSLNELYVNTII